MSRKRMTSWERRRRRRIRITIFATFAIVLLAAGGILIKLMLPYETWDIRDYYSVTYSGYNTRGSATLVRDEEKLRGALEQLKADERNSLLHLRTVTDEDYESFYQSIQGRLLTDSNLSNGSNIMIDYSFDEDLAKKLKVKLPYRSDSVMVVGLPTATVLSKDDIFKDLVVSFSGISPNVTMQITNSSKIPFIQNMVFQPLETKETYSVGETVSVRAFYSDEEALKQHYAVEIPSEQCIMEYPVTADGSYLSDSISLSQNVIDAAVEAGYNAFDNANEYGVRIFCEAHLMPVYVNKQATFKWVNPNVRSVYFKSLKPEHLGEAGLHYNELDVIYNVSITQADGVSCSCYAVVRFDDIIIRNDGSLVYDFSNPKIISADYKIDSVQKTVVTMYENTHNVIKVK